MLNQITPILIRIVVRGLQIRRLKMQKRPVRWLHACFCTGGSVHFPVKEKQECSAEAEGGGGGLWTPPTV